MTDFIGRFAKSVQSGVQKKRDEIRLGNEAKAAGKIWNSKTKQWYFYHLDEEFEAVAAEQAADVASNNGSGGTTSDERPVADREYYDLLQVKTNADANTIKKAYYKEARKCHPDKNPDDPEAHEKFQTLGTAYQVLSDENKRAAYDRDGKSESAGNGDAMQNVDPSVFFNVMFGSSLVEPYIGELWLASQTDSMMQDPSAMQDTENMTEEERDEVLMATMDAMKEKNKLKQKHRFVKCAQHLRERVKPYKNEGDKAAFKQSCLEEASQIVAGSYGDLYCMTIGFALQVAAEEYLGFEKSFLGLGGHVARTKKNASGFASGVKLLGAGIKAASAGSKAMKEAEGLQRAAEQGAEVGEQDAAAMAESIEGSLPAFLELAWAVNKRDIQSTLKAVCRKVFDDASVPKEDRFHRAEAVLILGKAFQKVGKVAQKANKSDEKLTADDVKARVAVATMTTMAKAQGQEVSEEDQAEMIKQAKMEMKAEKAASEETATPVPLSEEDKL